MPGPVGSQTAARLDLYTSSGFHPMSEDPLTALETDASAGVMPNQPGIVSEHRVSHPPEQQQPSTITIEVGKCYLGPHRKFCSKTLLLTLYHRLRTNLIHVDKRRFVASRSISDRGLNRSQARSKSLPCRTKQRSDLRSSFPGFIMVNLLALGFQAKRGSSCMLLKC